MVRRVRAVDANDTKRDAMRRLQMIPVWIGTPLKRPPGWKSPYTHTTGPEETCPGCLLCIADQLNEIIAEFDARRDAESVERLRAYAEHTALYLELRF